MRTADHEKINYLEFPSKDIAATKLFFSNVFNWQFTDPSGNEFAVWSNT